MEENIDCYRFEKIYFDDGILNDAVDATYIIHLEGNGRYDDIQKQLSQYHPTNTVYIVFNKGFKNCKKKLGEYIPPVDLVDAFLQCFKHSNKHNYNNILILEDDFIFDKKINEKKHQENVCSFLKNHSGKNFIYFLGCLPVLQVPYDYYTYQIIISTGTHACIYSKNVRTIILQMNQFSIFDWDGLFLMQMCGVTSKYAYYTPLCYQLFPQTENSKYWHIDKPQNTPFFNWIDTNFGKIHKLLFKILLLDQQLQPGYNFFYFFSRLLFFILLFLLYRFYKLIANNIFIKRKRKK
jgi:hypothetical protein